MNRRAAGLFLIFAAVTFWLAWLLMPDAATNDAAHILDVVRASRTTVWWSVIVQLVSSVAFVPAVMGLQADGHVRAAPGAQAGAILVLVGAMGMAADAIFHLAAYYMTADGVDGAAVLQAMRLLQTEGIRVLVPLLVPFFIGGWLYARALRKAGAATVWPERTFVAALIVAVTGAVLVAAAGLDRHLVALSFLGVIAAGYAALGYEQARAAMTPVRQSHLILYVADQAASRAFYGAVLQLEPFLDVPGMTEFRLGDGTILGLMPVSGITRLLGPALPDPATAAGAPRAELYLEVDDAGASHDRALAAGAREVSAVAARSWGHVAGYSLDPDGHVLAFAGRSAVGA